MKRNRTLLAIIGIVAVCTFGIALVSGAQQRDQQNTHQTQGKRPDRDQGQRGGGQNRQNDRKGGFGLNLAGIELSEEQKAQFQQQMRDFQVNTAEIRQQLQFAEQDIRKDMRNETVDQANIDSLWAKITELKQQFGEAQTNHMLAMKGILTAEQLATIQDNESAALELQKLRLEQRELLLASGAPDVQRLQQIQAQIAQKEVTLERERLENMAERFANMTPEEQEQLKNNRGRGKQAQPRR